VQKSPNSIHQEAKYYLIWEVRVREVYGTVR